MIKDVEWSYVQILGKVISWLDLRKLKSFILNRSLDSSDLSSFSQKIENIGS